MARNNDPLGKRLLDRSGLRPLLTRAVKKGTDLVTKPDHASMITAHFNGQVRFEGTEPVFDRPLWLLGFTNRSGSTLLGEYLGYHPELGGFSEALNHTNVARGSEKKGAASFPDYVTALVQPQARRNKAFGVKASWDQLQMLYQWRIDAMFPAVRLVHIRREDMVAQSISFLIAQQTRQWTSKQQQAPAAAPTYDFDRIRNQIPRLHHANDTIALTAAALGIATYNVTYETMIADPQGTLDKIFAWGGLPPFALTISETKLKKQATDVSAEFRDRFLADYRKTLG